MRPLAPTSLQIAGPPDFIIARADQFFIIRPPPWWVGLDSARAEHPVGTQSMPSRGLSCFSGRCDSIAMNAYLDTENLKPVELASEERTDLMEFLRSLDCPCDLTEPELPGN